MAQRVTDASTRRIERRRLELESAAGRLNALSPLATLERGYTIVRTPDRHTVRSVTQIERGANVDLVFRDGVASATVVDVGPNESPPDTGAASPAESQ